MADVILDTSTGQLPSSLAHMPFHVLYAIGGYLDVSSLWSMMKTSRSLREAAEAALKPHLAEVVVTGSGSFISDPYKPIQPTYVEHDDERAETLRMATHYAELQLFGYPPAAQLFRSLKIELRSDYHDYSWWIMGDYSKQIERLAINLLDDVSLKPHESIDELDEDGRWEGDDLLDGSVPETYLIWCRWISLRGSLDTPSLKFPNLTSLYLAATARTLAHFAVISRHTPNLQTLSLSAYRHDNIHPNYDITETPPFPFFPSLEKITVAGNGYSVADILYAIIRRNEHVQYLTIHTENTPLDRREEVAGHPALCISVTSSLRGLMLTGDMTSDVVVMMGGTQRGARELGATAEHRDAPDVAFAKLVVVVLEHDGLYPLLEQHPSLLPELPALHRLIFLNRSTDPAGVPTLGSSGLGRSEFALPSDVDDMFGQYPTLKIVYWANAILRHPFINFPFGRELGATANRLGLKCILFRQNLTWHRR